MFDAQKWYDEYDGPKSLTLDGLTYVCMIGYNVHGDEGRVVGKEAIGRSRVDWQAILQAYQRMAAIQRGRTGGGRSSGRGGGQDATV